MMAWCRMMIFGRAVVPEVQTTRAWSIGSLRSGRLAGSPGVSAAKNSSSGSFLPSGDHRPKRTRGAGWSPTIFCDVDLLVIDDKLRAERRGQRHHLLLVHLQIERADHRADPPGAEPDQQHFQIAVRQQQDAAALLDAAALQVGGDVDGDAVELAERDRWCRSRDRRWRACPDRAWRISPAARRPADRGWRACDPRKALTSFHSQNAGLVAPVIQSSARPFSPSG